jgi:hypothetical protein
MLVGLTLFSIVLVGLTVVVLWPRLGGGGAKGRRRLGPDRRPVVVHLRRDTLQHDLTIGEPPQDISSLFEIAGSAVVLVGAVAAAVLYARERAWAGAPGSGRPRHPGGGAVRRDGVVVHPPHRPEPARGPRSTCPAIPSTTRSTRPRGNERRGAPKIRGNFLTVLANGGTEDPKPPSGFTGPTLSHQLLFARYF